MTYTVRCSSDDLISSYTLLLAHTEPTASTILMTITAAGDAEGSHRAATAAVELFPEHAASRKMLAKLKKLFSVV